MTRTSFRCPECKSRDTRIHIYEDIEKLIYYRCKACSYLWDKNEYIIIGGIKCQEKNQYK